MFREAPSNYKFPLVMYGVLHMFPNVDVCFHLCSIVYIIAVPLASGGFLFWPLMVSMCSSLCSTGVHSALFDDVGVAATDEY